MKEFKSKESLRYVSDVNPFFSYQIQRISDQPGEWMFSSVMFEIEAECLHTDNLEMAKNTAQKRMFELVKNKVTLYTDILYELQPDETNSIQDKYIKQSEFYQKYVQSEIDDIARAIACMNKKILEEK